MSHLDLNVLLADQPEPSLRRATLHAMAVNDRDAHLAGIRALGKDIATPLRDFAVRNRVAPIVALALEEAFPRGYPGRDAWQAIYAREDARMAILLDRLDVIAARLAAGGIRMVALKNAGIARGVYPHRGACPMGDLDVLVERACFEEAHDRIVDAGFRLATRGTVEAADLAEGIEHGGTEYVGTFDGEEVWFELQWRPISGRWLRRDQEPGGDELVARSIPIPGTDVRLLCPEDNMIQVALHTAKHTYVRAPGLRLHTDVDRLATYAPPDWDAVVARLRALETTTAAYFSFALAKALLGSAVPDAVLTALAPPEWKRRALAAWLHRVDLFEPEQKKFTRPEMMGFTALLYDDGLGLLASALDARKDELSWGAAPTLLRRGVARVRDIVTRYQN